MTSAAADPSAPGAEAPTRRQPRWITPVLAALMALAGVVYAAGIKASMVHGYYSPAVYSMAHSWHAFFWGAYDPQATMSIDKIPFAFQIQALSVRIFGWSPAAILGPQVVEAVITIGVLFACVRRWIGPRAGLIAAIACATTPVVAAVSHSEVADMALTCLLTVAAYLWTRAFKSGSTGWLLLSGLAVGLAFQAKMVQAWGVLPALGLAWLLFAPGTWVRRLVQTLAAGLVAVAVSVWWIVVVSLTPPANRPYIDGSTTNSAWSMVFNYNLLARYDTGALNTPGAVGGWNYLVTEMVATQVGWLYPMALAGVVVGLWVRRRAPRTDLVRAGFVMWALWFAVHAVAFSTGRVAHSFYVLAVAPAVAALAAGGFWLLWRAWLAHRQLGWALVGAVLAQAVWTIYLSQQTPSFVPFVTPMVGVTSVVALGVLVLGLVKPDLRARDVRVRFHALALAMIATATLLAPTSWACYTAKNYYTGPSMAPAAGPWGAPGQAASGQGQGGGQRPGGAQGGAGGAQGGAQRPGPGGGAPPGPGGNGGPGGGNAAPGGGNGAAAPGGTGTGTTTGTGTSGTGPAGSGPAGMSGQEATAAIAWLQSHQPGTKYLVAVSGQGAGSLITAGASVLPMGGFTGANGFPTVNQLQALVSSGELRYVAPNSPGLPGANNPSEITTWVTRNCTAVADAPISGLYDCRRP